LNGRFNGKSRLKTDAAHLGLCPPPVGSQQRRSLLLLLAAAAAAAFFAAAYAANNPAGWWVNTRGRCALRTAAVAAAVGSLCRPARPHSAACRRGRTSTTTAPLLLPVVEFSALAQDAGPPGPAAAHAADEHGAHAPV